MYRVLIEKDRTSSPGWLMTNQSETERALADAGFDPRRVVEVWAQLFREDCAFVEMEDSDQAQKLCQRLNRANLKAYMKAP